MKNIQIDPLAAQDIQAQVDKVLRGLGNPEPPLDLRDVRDLLKLDLQFYSSTNTGPLREFVSRVKVGAKQLALRPTLIFDVVRKAGLKALWLPDRKRILIDESIPDLKKRHAEGHEITHSITPHHGPFLFGDDGETLRRSCHEKLEAEANFGSGQLLFLRNRFVEEAHDLPDMDETVKPVSRFIFPVSIFFLLVHLWRVLGLEARRFSTVNQPDIRVLLAEGRAGTHDFDSSGAASI